MKPKIVIFGSNGLLGRHIKAEVQKKFLGSGIIEISRTSKISILNPQTLGKILEPVIAFYCQGPTDPKVTAEVHEKFHVLLPQKWLGWLTDNVSLRKFITFGSVHETLKLSSGNNYLTSKKNWCKFLNDSENKQSLHFQLHTVYGNPVSRHSFIGNMLESIKSGQDFRMSEGRQLREYHHVEDISKKIVSTCDLEDALNRSIILSHGKPITLRALAEGVFERVNPPVKLKVGALPSHTSEVVENLWTPTPAPYTPLYRNPIEGVSKIIEESLILEK